MISKILGLFVNTFNADEKFSLLKRDILTQSVDYKNYLQLSIKKQVFLFFSTFLKSRSNLEHFEKKKDPHNLSPSDVRDCEKCGLTNV